MKFWYEKVDCIHLYRTGSSDELPWMRQILVMFSQVSQKTGNVMAIRSMIGFSSRFLSCRVNYYSMDHTQTVRRNKWNHKKYKGQQPALRRWLTSTGGKMLRKSIKKPLKISACKWNRSYRAVGYYKYRQLDKAKRENCIYLKHPNASYEMFRITEVVLYILAMYFVTCSTLRSFCTATVLLRWRSWYSDWLRAGQPRGLSSSLVSVKNFQTGYGSHPDPYPMGTGSYFAGGKAAGEWSGSIHPLPHTSS
jgi:hypothetical protein